jgi:hypothetical protein
MRKYAEGQQWQSHRGEVVIVVKVDVWDNPLMGERTRVWYRRIGQFGEAAWQDAEDFPMIFPRRAQ